MLKAELTHHLGYPEGGKRGPDGNARNGFPPKSLLTESWAISLEISRDHDGSFTPQFVPKGARRLPGFDETVLMLYARGLSTRELQAFLDERYQIPVSPDLISTITSEVLAEVETWQQRPLKATYVAGAFDALCVKIRDEGTVFPHTVIHQCVAHLVRQSLHHVSWTDRKVVAPALREIYHASTEAAARLALQRFAASPLG